MHCINCNTSLEPGIRFCPKCGAGVDPAQIFASDDGNIRFCMQCGKPLVKGARFCMDCGAAVEGDLFLDDEHSYEPAAPSISALRRCNYCGAPLEDSMLFCPSCGKKQDGTPQTGQKNSSPIQQVPSYIDHSFVNVELNRSNQRRTQNMPTRKNTVWWVVLIVTLFVVMAVMGIVVFKVLIPKSVDEKPKTVIEPENDEYYAEAENTFDEADQEKNDNVSSQKAESATQEFAPDTAEREDTDLSQRQNETEADTQQNSETAEEEPEGIQPAQPGENDSDSYEYYFYRVDDGGNYRTGSSNLSVWDCDRSKYLWPGDSVRLTNSDLDQLTAEQINYIKNEIYARHGYEFVKNMEVKSYFESRSWYSVNKNFSVEQFNQIEFDNIELIVAYQKLHR